MTDLAVAHLALRQADGAARGVQARAPEARDEAVEGRRARELHRVPGAGRCEPPAVEDDERDRARRHALATDAAAARIAAMLSTSRQAPPTSAPSTSGCDSSPAALSALTLPPYWMRISCAACSPTCPVRSTRMSACASWAICGVAVRPVPIAHTGS